MYLAAHELKFGLASSYYDKIRSGIKYFVDNKGKKILRRCRRTPTSAATSWTASAIS